jgi:hypothetical protein
MAEGGREESSEPPKSKADAGLATKQENKNVKKIIEQNVKS